LPTESRRRLLRGFTYLYISRDQHFGNGRCSRNSFERSVRRMANRLAKISDINHEVLTTLEPQDIEVAGIAETHLTALAEKAGSVRVQCADCNAAQVVDDQLLGTEMKCDSCQESFVANWGEPVMTLPQASEDLDVSHEDRDSPKEGANTEPE
jgi:ribosomal protein S27E